MGLPLWWGIMWLCAWAVLATVCALEAVRGALTIWRARKGSQASPDLKASLLDAFSQDEGIELAWCQSCGAPYWYRPGYWLDGGTPSNPGCPNCD